MILLSGQEIHEVTRPQAAEAKDSHQQHATNLTQVVKISTFNISQLKIKHIPGLNTIVDMYIGHMCI